MVTEIEGIGRLVNTIVDDAVFGRKFFRPTKEQAMRIQHLIDGKAVESRDYFETINPATQEVLAEVASGGAEEINAAVAAAKAAFPKWAALPAPSARR